MNLMRINATQAPVPALDIDLFWHTHQLSSSNYMPWCKHHIGRYINHDDTVGTGDLASGLDQTKAAWQRVYNEDYLNPSGGLTFQNANNAPREPRTASTADKTPPPNLTRAQRELWDFDVKQQITHEMMNYNFRQINEELIRANERLAALPQTSVQPPLGGFMTRHLKTALADTTPPTPRQNALKSCERITRRMCDAQLHHKRVQESWGRRRWPLLVAARGWGNPEVTLGEKNRPSQGK